MSSRPVLESRAADKAQLATLEREHRRRPRPLIDHSEFADDCTGAKYRQDPVFAQQRGYDDLQQALLELIATVARFSDDKKRFISFELTPCCARKKWSRQGGGHKLARSTRTNVLRYELNGLGHSPFHSSPLGAVVSRFFLFIFTVFSYELFLELKKIIKVLKGA